MSDKFNLAIQTDAALQKFRYVLDFNWACAVHNVRKKSDTGHIGVRKQQIWSLNIAFSRSPALNKVDHERTHCTDFNSYFHIHNQKKKLYI